MSRFVKSRTVVLTAAAAAVMLCATTVMAQVLPVPLLREGDALPGAPGETVGSLNNPVVNHAGGFALTVNTTGSGTTLSHVWGHATGGPGTVIISEGTFGNLQQTSFESFHGFSDAGVPSYGATSTDLVTGTTGLDGVWLGPMVVLNEQEPVPSLPGQFSTFNSRPSVTADGQPTWVGGFSSTQGGSTQNRALFFGVGASALLMGGDTIGGFAQPIDTGASNIDFDYRFSALGTNYIVQVRIDTSSSSDGVVVVNGDALSVAGGFLHESAAVPAALGGPAGENWDNFDFMGITESGQYLVTGDTDGSTSTDEFVLVDGAFALREGDAIDTPGGPATIAGSIEGGYLNEQGDWAVTWDLDTTGGDNVETLIFNGEVLLMEGDPADLDGDGVPDPGATFAGFVGITTLVVGDRDAGGGLSIYFTADVDTQGTSSSSDDVEGLFRIDIEGDGPPVLVVGLDIKPGSCPNPFNPTSNGVLPMSIVGTMEFDATAIDPSTIVIARADGIGGEVGVSQGPPGPAPGLEDRATPFDGEACDCHELTGDGVLDLSVFFHSSFLAQELSLDGVTGGDQVELVVSGLLADGTPFRASDCVKIVPPANAGQPQSSAQQHAGEGTVGLAPQPQPKDDPTTRPGSLARRPDGPVARGRAAGPRQSAIERRD